MNRRCAGCPPHAIHYGLCRYFDGCDCKLEEPPLTDVYVETCAERGYADDDQHEDWIVFGESRDQMWRDRQERRRMTN